MTLHNYKYVAINPQGRKVRGRVEAINRAICIKYLQNKKLEVVKVTEYQSLIARLDQITFGNVLKTKDLIFFLKQIGALLKAGIPLISALEILSLQQEKRHHRRLYFELYQHVYNGIAFSKALGKRPLEFPRLLVQMVEIGELTGDLSGMVIEMAEYYDAQLKLSTQIKGALRMPIIYLVLTFLVALGLMMFVFPNIAGLYASFEGAELPAITKFFLDLSTFLSTYTVWILGGLVAIILSFYLLNRYVKAFHQGVTVLVLQMPVFGQLVQMHNQILISNALAKMMGQGVQTIKALQTTRAALHNVVYQKLLDQTLAYVEDGMPFSKSFAESPYIDPIMGRMLSTGERAGEVPKMMSNLAYYYNGISEIKVERLKNSIQPILLIFTYGVLGLMILALMLPMLSLGGQI